MKKNLLVCSALLSLMPGVGAAQSSVDFTGGTLMDSLCTDATSGFHCTVDLRNGDFEAPINATDPYRWQLEAPRGTRFPYLGRTPDSRTLALPGRGAKAWAEAPLPPVAASAELQEHSYTLRLRARGSGPMPADVAMTLLVTGPGEPDGGRELATVTHSVGWEWEPLHLKVHRLAVAAPARLSVRIERTDGNTPTMLQVDDVRILRAPADPWNH
ncbi:hypothetical protein [Luteibacter sp. E-22]|uniref:hypothetical protein n=1 Tax=Luteibacter sp. E-22 TaxID=3404050 RepID=UPI003CEA33FA